MRMEQSFLASKIVAAGVESQFQKEQLQRE